MPSFRLRSSSSTVLRNITIDDSDSSLVYSQGWTKSSSSNAFGGGFSTTSQVGDIVQFFLPENAVAIYYNGFKQPGGGICGVCLDCDAKGSGNLQTIDVHSTSNDGAPTTLFSKMEIDPSVKHSFSLLNFPDSRFGGNGTTTVDSFIVTIQGDALPSASISGWGSDANLVPNSESTAVPLTDIETKSASVTFIQTSTATSTATSTSTSSSSSTTSADGSSASHTFSNDTASGKSGVAKSPIAIAGISVVSLLVGCTIVYALMYFMRRRRRKQNAPFVQIHQYTLPPSREPPPVSSTPPLPMQMQMEQQFVAPVTVPAQAAMATGMGMTSKGEFFSGAGMRSPISPDLSSAGMTTYSAQDPFQDGEAPRVGVPVSPPPRVLTPGTPPNALRSLSPPPRSLTPGSSGSPSAYVAPRAPVTKRPETEYIENPFLAAEVEARTRALIAERALNYPQQQQHPHHHHQTQSLDRFDHSPTQESGQDVRPVSTMTMNPLPMPNLHEAKRKNSWELL